jgi:hypothetical protein
MMQTELMAVSKVYLYSSQLVGFNRWIVGASLNSSVLSAWSEARSPDKIMESWSLAGVNTAVNIQCVCDPIKQLNVTNVTSTSLFLGFSIPPDDVLVSYTKVLSVLSKVDSVEIIGMTDDNITNVVREHGVLIWDIPPNTEFLLSASWMSPRCFHVTRQWTIQVKTLEDAPYDAPHHVVVSSLSSTSFNLTWSPPLQPNGVIVAYQVDTYVLVDAGDNQTAAIEITLPSTSKMLVSSAATMYPWLFLDNLTAHSSYVVLISARTSVGFGPEVQYAVSTPEDCTCSALSFNLFITILISH